MTEITARRQVHVAGPIEGSGEQRCLGCNSIIVPANGDYLNVGDRVAVVYDGPKERWVKTRIREQRKLNDSEAYCHTVRREVDAA